MSHNKQSPAKNTIQRIARTALTILVFATIASAARKLAGNTDITGSLATSHFLLATMLAVLYRAINPLGWVLVLRGLGYRVNSLVATNIWLIAESRRWLPGGVWGYASRAVESKKLGVPVSVASASMLVELLITIAAAALVSTFGLLLYFGELKDAVTHLLTSHATSGLTVLASVSSVVALGCIGYLFRSKLTSKLGALSNKWRLMQSVDFNSRSLASALGYLVVMACLNGVVNLILLQAVSDDGGVPVVVMIAATTAAWVVGYLAFFSPGGLLVREAALATLLLPWVPYPTAIAVATASRIAQLLAEVICMLPGLLLSPTQCRGEERKLTMKEGVSTP